MGDKKDDNSKSMEEEMARRAAEAEAKRTLDKKLGENK